MKRDPGSNYEFSEGIAADAAVSTGDTATASVDHAKGDSAAFFISVGDVGASGTVDAKLQHSDDDSVWTDDDGTAGNDAAITQITAAGSAIIKCPNPTKRYSRVLLTVGANTVVASVTNVVGPLRHVAP